LRWIGAAAAFALALAFLGALIVAGDESGRTKLIEAAVFVGAPAMVFVLSAVPLWRESRNRALLVGAGTLAAVSAVVLAIITWGFGLPVSFGLLAIAIADLNRAVTLSGLSGRRRVLALGGALVAAAVLLGFAVPVALLLAIAGAGIVAWNLR
jgi:hypothetical protein